MGMKTGRRRTAEERRSEITEAANAIALSDGLSAITLRSVAAQSGMTPALVAHYITSMEELSNKTFLGIVRAQLLNLQKEIKEGSSPVNQLNATLERLFDEKHQEIDLVWAEAWSLGRRRESLANILREESDRWLATFQDIVETGQTEGVFHVEDLKGAAFTLLCIIDGSNAHSLVRWGDPSERTAQLESAIENLLGAESGTLQRARTAAPGVIEHGSTPAR